jgi:hypothetical protein
MPVRLRAALGYFAIVFAAGFLLGTFRTLLVIPRTGELLGTILELPIMLVIAWYSCRSIMRRFRQIDTVQAALVVGGAALLLLLMAEALLSVALFGLSLSQHLALYRKLPVQIGLLGQICFSLFPLISLNLRTV